MTARDENIARVHIGMEEAVAKHLSKEDFNAPFGELFHIGALVEQGRHIGHGQTADALHDHHLVPTPVPVNLGHIEQRRVFEITPQL